MLEQGNLSLNRRKGGYDVVDEDNCPYRDDNPPCDNRVGIAYSIRKEKFPPSLSICAACMEGIRTRAYIKKLLRM